MRLYDRIVRDGLRDTQTDDLASVALADLRQGAPVLAVDQAVEHYRAAPFPIDHLWAVLPYVPTLFIEAFVGQDPDPHAPAEIGALALRTDLWTGLPGGARSYDRVAALVAQRLADSPNGSMLPMTQRATLDPVRWQVDWHLFMRRDPDDQIPVGPVLSLTSFLTPTNAFARDLDGAPFRAPVLRPTHVDAMRAWLPWHDALCFGLALGWCRNVAVIQTEAPQNERAAYQRRTGRLPCDPLLLAPGLDFAAQNAIIQGERPYLSANRFLVPPGRFAGELPEEREWQRDEPGVQPLDAAAENDERERIAEEIGA